MVDVQDDSWRGCFTVWLYLAAKPSHLGVDVDGLAALCIILWFIAARRGDSVTPLVSL